MRKKIKKLMAEPLALAGVIIIIFILLVAIFAPFIATHDPQRTDPINRLKPPSTENWMGTDNLGRDTYSRVVFGTRIALLVSLLAISFATLLGLTFGIIAGFFGGRIDSTFLIFFDIIKSFPALLLAITIIAITGPSLPMLIIIIGITRFPAYSRLVRAQTLRVKGHDYILAAKALGVSIPRTMFKHLLPNVLGPVFIQAAMDIPIVITFEAGLSFLGLGVPPPTPSWGAILRTGYSFIRTAPYMVIFGGAVLMLTTLGFTLMGETLRDFLDPKLRKVV